MKPCQQLRIGPRCVRSATHQIKRGRGPWRNVCENCLAMVMKCKAPQDRFTTRVLREEGK